MHTICTHTEHNTENKHTPQHRTPAYDLHTYSFDFYDEHNISKNVIT